MGGDKPTSLCSKINIQGDCMIDFVKIVINSKEFANEILNNSLLQFFTPTDHQTGDYKHIKTAKFKGMEFMVYDSGRVNIRGSLHKYSNEGRHNYNDFYYNQLLKVVDDLQAKFKINPLEARLENVEFGVNINPSFNPTSFYENVIAYKNLSFNSMNNFADKKQIGINLYRQQYGVKIYDKGKQYQQKQNILRIEKKCLKMQLLKRYGIVTLSDLLNKNKLEALGNELTDMFSKVIVNDNSIDLKCLTVNERKIYAQCSNPKEWERFNRKKRHKMRIVFERIIETYGHQHWKQQTTELIKNKWNELLKSGDVLTKPKKKSRDILTIQVNG